MSRVGFLLILGILSLASLCYSQEQGESAMANSEKTENPIVELKTTMGTIKIELFAEKAPITVKNFLGYVNEGFYNHTIFHRVKDGFMVQGGGFKTAAQDIGRAGGWPRIASGLSATDLPAPARPQGERS